MRRLPILIFALALGAPALADEPRTDVADDWIVKKRAEWRQRVRDAEEVQKTLADRIVSIEDALARAPKDAALARELRRLKDERAKAGNEARTYRRQDGETLEDWERGLMSTDWGRLRRQRLWLGQPKDPAGREKLAAIVSEMNDLESRFLKRWPDRTSIIARFVWARTMREREDAAKRSASEGAIDRGTAWLRRMQQLRPAAFGWKQASDVREAVDALRTEVRALRADVAELKALLTKDGTPR